MISGYLITRNIFVDIEQDRFTFSNFYHRRARRLLPALFATILATLIASIFFLRPEYLADTYRSAMYAVLSASNILFWLEADYFANAAHVKPLLHTWSLAVEEQFYLIWPALLVLLAQFRRKSVILSVLALMTVISLVLAEYYVSRNPAAVFYLLPFRIGELAIGAMCVWLRPSRALPTLLQEIMTLAGLAAILASSCLYNSETPFPGLYSLPPVLGTAMIILCGASRFGGVLLSSRPVVAIGLISYSMYLVHWPIIVFLRMSTLTELAVWHGLGVLAASMSLAAALYWTVERPLRYGINRPGALGAPAAGFLAVTVGAALVFISAHGWAQQGWPGRFGVDFVELETVRQQQVKERRLMLRDDCNIGSMPRHKQGELNLDECFRLSPDRPNVMIIGSSFASGDAEVLKLAYPEVNFLQLSSPGCLPSVTPEKGPELCAKISRALYDFLQDGPPVDAVIISHNWRKPNFRELPAMLAGFAEQDIPVVIFGPRGRLRAPLVDVLNLLPGANKRARLSFSEADDDFDDLNRHLRSLAARNNARYIEIKPLLWGDEGLPIFVEPDRMIFIDEGHYSAAGVRYAAQVLKEAYPDIGVLTGEKIRISDPTKRAD